MHKRILIINPFGIGDVLFTTPLVAGVRRAFPDSFIAYLCNARTKEVLAKNPNIDELIVFEKDDWRRLWRSSIPKFIKEFLSFILKVKRKNFELAIDLSLSRQYGFFLKLIGIPNRFGYNYKNRGIFLTRKIPLQGYAEKHVAEYYLDLLKLLGAERPEGRLEFYISQEDEDWARGYIKENGLSTENLIGIVPGGGESWGGDALYKQWGAGNFAHLADKLIDKYNAHVLILGSRNDAELCQEVRSRAKHNLLDASGKTRIAQFAALCGLCKLVVCNDGGPLHVAVAKGAKTCSIFGPVDDKVYGPYPRDSHIVVKKDLPCRPCYKKFKFEKCATKECLSSISPEEVLQACGKLL